jgi:hypothetical protein
MSRKHATTGALMGAAVIDGLWALDSGKPSPLFAAAAFAVVALLVGLRQEYRAGLVVGIAGIAAHAFELVFHGVRGLHVVEGVLFAANLVLSLIVALCSWSLMRDRARSSGA